METLKAIAQIVLVSYVIVLSVKSKKESSLTRIEAWLVIIAVLLIGSY